MDLKRTRQPNEHIQDTLYRINKCFVENHMLRAITVYSHIHHIDTLIKFSPH